MKDAPEKIVVIACGALAREILDIKTANGLCHLELECLPADLHNTPDQIPARMQTKIDELRARGIENIFCAYADCGTGGLLDKVLDAENIPRLPGPHCYAFFSGTNAFIQQSEDEFTSFYLTDFLARQFDAFVIRPLGLDRHPELRDSYFGHYEKLVYLSQIHDDVALKAAEEAADYLGLVFEHRHTGYGELASELIKV